MTAADRLLSRWPLVVACAVALHLAFGVLGRGVWKPDEPREAAIAARMARPGADRVVPHLADAAFCEKPPLYYWVAAASIRALGSSAAAARLPNLLYAVAGALLAAALARAAAGRAGALAAGLLMGTLYLAYRVAVWLATDALLMTAVAGALLGCWRGLAAARGRGKLAWYSLMHAFLAVGFLTKNVVAWVVPALALAAFVAWERRWRELAAWELWAPFAIQVAAAAPWVAAVAARPEGAEYLRAFFVNNLLGRFTQIPGVGYTQSHPGSPGAYLVQLPVFLLPWTLPFVAVAVAAWRRCRDGARREAWRFAVAAAVPGLALLSASATARDVYAGVLMPGFALLGALWVEEAVGAPSRLDLAMARAGAAFLAAVALLLPPAVLVAAVRFGAPAVSTPSAALVVGWIAAVGLASISWRAARGGRLGRSLAGAAAAWVVAWSCWAPLAFPVVDRAQDIAPAARAAAEAAARHPLALWRPDETIIAVLDREAGLAPRRIGDAAELGAALAAAPDLRILAEATPAKARASGLAEVEGEFSLAPLRRVDLPPPGGRSYVILGTPVER